MFAGRQEEFKEDDEAPEYTDPGTLLGETSRKHENASILNNIRAACSTPV